MSTLPKVPANGSPLHAELISMTLHGWQVARKAVTRVADALASPSRAAFEEVADCERELDRLDREVDERIAFAVAQAKVSQAREVLACLKFMTDLERIGDLVCALGSHAQAVGSRIEMADLTDLIKMASILENMLGNAYDGFSRRDLERAVAVVKADAEIDRLRNLVFIRNLNHQGNMGAVTVQVLFMTQCLERAADHAVNLGEEICHVITGHTIRHMRREMDKSYEEKYLVWLRQQAKGACTRGIRARASDSPGFRFSSGQNFGSE